MSNIKNISVSFIFYLSLFQSVLCNSGFAQNNYPLLYEETFDSGSTNWSANIPENWRDGSDEQGNFYELIQNGPLGTPRRPTSISILKPYNVGNFELQVIAKSNKDTTIKARDICLFFGYQDSIRFYYAHFSAISENIHNIIAIVNKADRFKINTEPVGTTKALLKDYKYHTLKIKRTVDNGTIEASIDGKLIMTAVDSTFLDGKIGIGSFDDVATFKSVKLWGEKTESYKND